MHRIASSGNGFMLMTFVALALAAPLSTAHAQANRTFVSGHGTDTGTCTLTAPCRSFAYALSQTIKGGEITTLDPAGYGSVTIDRAVSIVNDGVGEAGITAPAGTSGITITAGITDVVNLIGLTVVGGGAGSGTAGSGIALTQGGGLNVQNCVIRNFSGNGIAFLPNANFPFNGYLNVSDTVVSNNGQAAVGGSGIDVAPTGSGRFTITLTRVQAVGNAQNGISLVAPAASAGVSATVADSGISGNPHYGLEVQSAGNPATAIVTGSEIVASNVGAVSSGSAASLYLTANTIVGNATAYEAMSSGTVASYGDNYIIANTDNGGTLTPATER